MSIHGNPARYLLGNTAHCAADIQLVQGTLLSLGNGVYSFQNQNIYDGTLLPGDLITVRWSLIAFCFLILLCKSGMLLGLCVLTLHPTQFADIRRARSCMIAPAAGVFWTLTA